VAAQVGALAGDMARLRYVHNTDAEWAFSLSARTFYEEYAAPTGKREAVKFPEFVPEKGEEEACMRFQWKDVPPSLIDLHRPLVSIEYSEDGLSWNALKIKDIPVNDEGYDIAVVFPDRTAGAGMWVYEARWYNPEKKDGRWYRFKIEPRDTQTVFYSDKFR
jgi:hypothetical protein